MNPKDIPPQGLTFEQILPEIRKGRKYKRKADMQYQVFDMTFEVDYTDINATDWELEPETFIVTEEQLKVAWGFAHSTPQVDYFETFKKHLRIKAKSK